MEEFRDTCIRLGPYVCTGLVVFGATIYVIKKIRKPKKRFVDLMLFSNEQEEVIFWVMYSRIIAVTSNSFQKDYKQLHIVLFHFHA